MTELNGLNGIKAMSDKMFALTWKEPFASLMLHGKCETRTWDTKVRGLVLICAALRAYNVEEVNRIAGPAQAYRIIDTLVRSNRQMDGRTYGKAIAVGELTGSRPMISKDEDKCFVQYWPGLWVHIYENVRPIIPFDWKGKRGWKEVPQEIQSQIKFI